MGESGDCLIRYFAVFGNLPGGILQGGVRNGGLEARKLKLRKRYLAWSVVLVDVGVGVCPVVTMDAHTVNAGYEVPVMSRRNCGISEAGCAVCTRKR